MTELHNRICNMNPEDFEKLVNGLSQKQLFDLQGPRIAAHRGRGVNAKPIGWPENTLAAAKAAIQQFDASDKYGGHAIECDIHVTADGYAILAHGPIAENYCVVDDAFIEIATKIGKPKDSKAKDKLRFDELSVEYVQQLTVLTTPYSIPDGYSSEDYRIPTLYEFLELIAVTNANRIKNNQFPLLANIELKGLGSGLATLQAIERFNQDQVSKKTSTINPAHIVLLGRVTETHELTVARQVSDQYTAFNKKSSQAVTLSEFFQDIERYQRVKELIKSEIAFYTNHKSSHHIGFRQVDGICLRKSKCFFYDFL